MTINKFAVHGYSNGPVASTLQIKRKIPIRAYNQFIDLNGKTTVDGSSYWPCGIWFYLDGYVYLVHTLNQKPLTPASREWI
jgi:hypothetical protein